MEILEGPAWERAESLADVPPEHWHSWLLGRYGFRRGDNLKNEARFVLENLRVIEAGGPPGWGHLGCGTLGDVLAEFDLTPEQWDYLKAGEPVLLPGDTVEQGVAKGKARVQELAENPKVLKEPHRPKKEEVLSDNTSSPTQRGVSADYLTARIARDRPDVLERMRAGEFRSVRAAAVEAGIVRVPTALDVLRRAWAKATPEQRAEFLAFIEAE